MKTKIINLLVFTLLSQAAFAATGIYSVPGASDPWLAGMPNGSTASSGDIAPTHSPVSATGIPIFGSAALSFSVSGTVSRGSPLPFFGPDGEAASDYHWDGAQNGIANITAPLESLIGVFLGLDAPNLHPAPSALNFGSALSRDYLTLSPVLQQPFFIGDGLTSLGAVQQVVAPVGATRLFLGTMDEYGWWNNLGSFTVQVVVVPEPSFIGLVSVGVVSFCLCRKGRNK